MKQQILKELIKVLGLLGLDVSAEELSKIKIEYPDAKFGDYSSNVALILAKKSGMVPRALAEKIVAAWDNPRFVVKEIAGPGFINFKVAPAVLVSTLTATNQTLQNDSSQKILVEYFQPNIAKPLHIGHLRTAIIGDALVRGLKFLGHDVESDTHMGDWGTQFGLLILAYKKYGNEDEINKDPVNVLNQYYIQINKDAEGDDAVREAGKQEFVKLEQGGAENRKIWKRFVDWSMEKFLAINDLMDITPFDHHWPESFYEDKMPAVVEELKSKSLLVESQGAQIVNLEEQGLGVAVVVKSDGGTTYLLRDLATFIYRQSLGFEKQIYVVDNRQSHAFLQLFAILKLLGRMKDGEAVHVDYGMITFKGEVLSTRKGNMVTAQDVIAQAQEKVAQIIDEKNPELANKDEAIKTIAKGALKYYDLSHNARSDIDFDWKEALDFNGNSGPYLQYTYARLSSVVRKVGQVGTASINPNVSMTDTEKQLAIENTKLSEVVELAMEDYSPNLMANYLFGLANLANRFYHESPVVSEPDAEKQVLRLALVQKTRQTLKGGLDLLGIGVLEEM
jgi:arginyl-tRNA synthetase